MRGVLVLVVISSLTTRLADVLKQRVITAIIFFSAFLLSLFILPKLFFIAFVTSLMLVGLWEWANISGFILVWQRALYVFISLGLTLLLSIFLGFVEGGLSQDWIQQLFIVAVVWWSVALLWIQSYPSSVIFWGSRWIRIVIGWLVLVPAFFALIYLHMLPDGASLILLLVLTVVSADVGAYFTGKAFGARKLAVQVSPGKTWEGFFGGLCSCFVLSLVVGLFKGFQHWPVLATILIFTGLGSVVGDLLESMIKRHRGVKDSGHFLPGHGGMLDRLDSVSAAAPIFVLGIIASAGFGGI